MTVVFVLLEALKSAFNREWFNRIIPILALVFGAGLGVLAFYFAPSIIPAENVLTAVILGAMSGWSATGADQVIKQLTKKEV